jgi:hypothetical protein
VAKAGWTALQLLMHFSIVTKQFLMIKYVESMLVLSDNFHFEIAVFAMS